MCTELGAGLRCPAHHLVEDPSEPKLEDPDEDLLETKGKLVGSSLPAATDTHLHTRVGPSSLSVWIGDDMGEKSTQEGRGLLGTELDGSIRTQFSLVGAVVHQESDATTQPQVFTEGMEVATTTADEHPGSFLCSAHDEFEIYDIVLEGLRNPSGSVAVEVPGAGDRTADDTEPNEYTPVDDLVDLLTGLVDLDLLGEVLGLQEVDVLLHLVELLGDIFIQLGTGLAKALLRLIEQLLDLSLGVKVHLGQGPLKLEVGQDLRADRLDVGEILLQVLEGVESLAQLSDVVGLRVQRHHRGLGGGGSGVHDAGKQGQHQQDHDLHGLSLSFSCVFLLLTLELERARFFLESRRILAVRAPTSAELHAALRAQLQRDLPDQAVDRTTRLVAQLLNPLGQLLGGLETLQHEVDQEPATLGGGPIEDLADTLVAHGLGNILAIHRALRERLGLLGKVAHLRGFASLRDRGEQDDQDHSDNLHDRLLFQ